MGLAFYQLNNKQDSVQFTASSVTLIPKYMGRTRTEDPSFIVDGHAHDGSSVLVRPIYLGMSVTLLAVNCTESCLLLSW